MRKTAASRIALTLVAATAVLIPLGCATTPNATAATTHTASQMVERPHYEEDDPQWNCQLDGDHKCSHVPACWTEHKPDAGLPDERLCGLADTAAPNSDGWVYGDFMHNTAIR